MTKWAMILVAVAAALVPAAGSAQEIGVSFRVSERPAQPTLIASASGRTAAEIPAGWAYSVNRGPTGGAGAPRLSSSRSSSTPLVLPEPVAGDAAEPVTVMFVPI